MLITFQSDAGAKFTLFGDVALQLIGMMGHTPCVPGALLAADVPDALAKLEQAIRDSPAQPSDADRQSDDDDDDEIEANPVSLDTRAYPLIEMLRAAARNQCDVMWSS